MEPVERNNLNEHETNIPRDEDSAPEVERSGAVVREEDSDNEQEESNRERSSERQTQTQRHEPLSLQGPVLEILCKEVLLSALRELWIKDPDKFYRECCGDVKKLIKRGVLDRYILSPEEAAAVCAAFRLMKSGFNFDKVFDEEKFSSFGIAILVSIRKLPVYKGKLFYCHKLDVPIRREERDDIKWPFYLASKNMTFAEEFLCSSNNTGEFKEVLSIEEGWGYDISDFVVTVDGKDNVALEAQSKFASFFISLVRFN